MNAVSHVFGDCLFDQRGKTISQQLAEIERLQAELERLKEASEKQHKLYETVCWALEQRDKQLHEFAQEIERLQADIEALRKTLAGVKSMFADELEKNWVCRTDGT